MMNDGRMFQSYVTQGSSRGSGDSRTTDDAQQEDIEYKSFQRSLKEEWLRHPYIPNDKASRMKHLLESQALADVTFLVGDDKVEVRAHRFILRDQSDFFQALFSTRWSAQNQEGIEIPGVEPEDFEVFLDFLYTGSTGFEIHNALPLLYLSRVYQIPKLGNATVLFLMKNMSKEIAIPVLKSISSFDDPDAKALCKAAVNIVCKNASKVFEQPEFKELRYEDLHLIMSESIENCEKISHPNECELFKSCIRWAAAECERQNLQKKPQNFRNVLGDVFNKIRFPLIEKSGLFFKYYFDGVFEGVFKEDERDALKSYWTESNKSWVTEMLNKGNRLEVQKYFKLKPRATTIFSVNRFSAFDSSEKSWTYCSRVLKADRISFQVNVAGTIHGIGLYGNANANRSNSSFEYEVDVQMYAHHRMETVYLSESFKKNITDKEEHETKGRVFRLMFKKPVTVVRNVWYTISTVFKGAGRSFHGINGQSTVKFECQQYPIIFNFQDAVDRKPGEFKSQRLSSNGTGVTKGQIPIIYFAFTDDEDDEDDVQMVDIID